MDVNVVGSPASLRESRLLPPPLHALSLSLH